MRSQKIKYAALLIVFTILVSVLYSCSKGHQACCSGSQNGVFYIHLHTNIDTNEVDDTTALYPDATGRHFSLNTARFFISGVTLVNANGTTSAISATILKIIDSEAYLVGSAPIGTYTSVYFNVGLDSATNALPLAQFNPTTYIPVSNMYYGNSTQGYYFMELIGSADTTATQTGTNLVPFCYKIGGNARLKQVQMPVRSNTGALKPWVLTANSTQYIHLICDYGKLLTGINFKSQDSTDSYTQRTALADSIVANISNMFTYEE